jgi:hypothetical protein
LSAFEVGLKMFTVLRSCSAYAVYKEIYLRCGCTISFDSMTSRLISTLNYLFRVGSRLMRNLKMRLKNPRGTKQMIGKV